MCGRSFELFADKRLKHTQESLKHEMMAVFCLFTRFYLDVPCNLCRECTRFSRQSDEPALRSDAWLPIKSFCKCGGLKFMRWKYSGSDLQRYLWSGCFGITRHFQASLTDNAESQMILVSGIAAFPFLNGNNKYTGVTKLNIGVCYFFPWLYLDHVLVCSLYLQRDPCYMMDRYVVGFFLTSWPLF